MYYYLNAFFIFSIIGHFLESVLHPSYESGILNGYWTPIYGIGVVVILLINKVLKEKLKVSKYFYPFILFITCSIVLAIIELIGGHLIQFLFKRVFWNYKYQKFNIGIYTSLEMAIVWGIASIVTVYILKPIIDFVVPKIPKVITNILLILFITDILYKISEIVK